MDNKDFICELFGLKEILKLSKTGTKTANNICMKKDKTISENARSVGNNLYIQKNHNQEIHNDTLMQYTKSIAFAPKESEQLALGYGNRSALLLHLHRYKECLVDVDRALEITKSDKLRIKLESRKLECVTCLLHIDANANEKSVEDGEIIGKLKLAVTSSKIPCAAEFVSIDSNPMYKRQLTATRDIKPGEIVITEKAYACCPTITQRYLVCSHCLSFAWSGIPCDFCTFSIYCSESCKKEALKEYHDIECSIVLSIFSFFSVVGGRKASSDFERKLIRRIILLARVFIKAVKAEGFSSVLKEAELIDNGTLDVFSGGVFDGNKFGCIYSLRSHPKKTITNFKQYTCEALVLYLLIKRTNLLPVAKKLRKLTLTDGRMIIRLRDIFVKLLSIIDLNGYSYQWYKCIHETGLSGCGEKCSSLRGGLIAPFSAMINHSCVPNLGRFTLPQPKIIVYASKPIKKGEQLFLSYGPSFQSGLAERKLNLERMDYTCRCPVCRDDQSFKKINKETVVFKLKSVESEFNKIFGKNAMNFFFDGHDPRKWMVFTETSQKQAFKLIELFHKHFQFNEACNLSWELEFYTRRVFHELYGEKCITASDC